MSDSYIQLQVPMGPIRPPWAAPSHVGLWDDVREDFSRGDYAWDAAHAFVARLFDTSWEPDFGTPTSLLQVPSSVWMSDAVALQNVATLDGYCQALGLRFPQVLETRQLGGVAIYDGGGRMVWAATDWIGNQPVLQQDVYVVWPGNFGGPFRL